jgi:hypothetical protein
MNLQFDQLSLESYKNISSICTHRFENKYYCPCCEKNYKNKSLFIVHTKRKKNMEKIWEKLNIGFENYPEIRIDRDDENIIYDMIKKRWEYISQVFYSSSKMPRREDWY